MSNLFELKKTAANSFRQTAALVEKMGYGPSAEAIRETERDFLKKELMVVTVGEMRRGKSSMLNALLGEKDPVFPVDVAVCTNVVTIVRYGKTEKVEVILEQPKKNMMIPVVKTIARNEIPDYVSEQGNPSNYKNVKVVNVEIPNPVLQEGVVFVDTPGVGSLNINHAETTYGFLPNADLLLFVSDAAAGLTETELNFLKKGYKYCKNVLFPLTKKDLNPAYKEIEQDNRKKISEALGISGEEVTVVPISSTARLRYLETQSRAMLASSNYTEFEDTIWSFIGEKRGEIMFLPFVERVRQELYKVAEDVATQYQMLHSAKEKIPEFVEELKKETEKYKKLGQGNASWRKEVSQFFAMMKNNNDYTISQLKLNTRKHVDESIENLGVKICGSDQYNCVYNEINSMISEELLDMKEKMVSDTMAEVEKLNEDLGLKVDSHRNALDNVNFKPDSEMRVTFPERKKSDKLMAGGRKIGMGMMGGSKIGMLAGGILGAGLAIVAGPAVLAAQIGTTAATAVIATAAGGSVAGTTIGSFIGGAKGCIDAAKTGRDVDVPVVRKAFCNHIDSSMNLLKKIVDDGYITLKSEVTDDMADKLKRKSQELQDSIERMKKNLSSVRSNEDKLEGLMKQSDALNRALAQFDKLEENVGRLGASERKAEHGSPDRAVPSKYGQAAGKAEETEYSFL